MWVYRERYEKGEEYIPKPDEIFEMVYEVGYYMPDKNFVFHTVKIFDIEEEAAQYVHYLNGGSKNYSTEKEKLIDEIINYFAEIVGEQINK